MNATQRQGTGQGATLIKMELPQQERRLVARFRESLGPEMKVIATGGLASVIAAETDVIDAVDPWLTLEGLRLIWEMNQGAGT